jgi:hypothetical protein
MTSARELSRGITKLSGSRPLLKVRIATLKETKIMTAPAKKFVARSKKRKVKASKTLEGNRYRLEISAYIMNITAEAIHTAAI